MIDKPSGIKVARFGLDFILQRVCFTIFSNFSDRLRPYSYRRSVFPATGEPLTVAWSMRDFVPLTILSGAIMAKFINPFTDVGFKIIFGQEMTKDLLIDFLNDLLVGERHIQDRCVLHEFPSG